VSDQPATPSFASRRDDTVAGLCGVWMIAGLFVDGWAHRNQKPETFFTPWHGILYSGFMASAAWMLFVIRRHQRPGVPFRKTLPVGYDCRAAGVALFGVGAIGDLIWHQVFGIEVNIDALLSPTHLILLTGGLLMAAGPVISTFAREGANQRPLWSSTGTIVATVAFIVSLLQFFLMYVSPYDNGIFTVDTIRDARNEGGRWLRNELHVVGISGILLFTFVTVCALLFLVRRIEIPRGAFVAVIFIPAVLQTVLTSFHTAPRLIGAGVASLLAELTWPRIRTFRSRALVACWLSVLMMTMWFGLFAGVAIGGEGGVGWSVHSWTGVPVLAGIVTALMALATDSPTHSRTNDHFGDKLNG
jgi:hypothetical protein